MTIDVHTHVVPAQLPFDAGSELRWPTLDAATGEVFVNGDVFRRVRREAWDLEARLADMQRRGCGAQVLSAMPMLFSYWAPLDQAQRFCSGLNHWLADAVRRHPGRFYGLGVLPMQEPEAAAAGLAEVKRLGLSGVELGTNIAGVSIADARFRPVFEEADRLGLSVFLHPFQPPLGPAVDASTSSAVCFPLDIGFAVAGLIANGVLHRCPGLRLCASHGGGSVAFTLSRLTHAWQAKPGLRDRLPEAPDVVARRLFYDILLFDAAPLRYLIEIMGREQVVMGSDYPFLDVPPEWPLTDLALPAEALEAIRVTNARRFLGITAR